MFIQQAQVFRHSDQSRSTVVSVMHEVDRDDFCWQHQYTGERTLTPWERTFPRGHFPPQALLTLACDGIRQEVQVLRWTHANQLTDQSTIINRRRGVQPGGLQPGFDWLASSFILLCSTAFVHMSTHVRTFSHEHCHSMWSFIASWLMYVCQGLHLFPTCDVRLLQTLCNDEFYIMVSLFYHSWVSGWVNVSSGTGPPW